MKKNRRIIEIVSPFVVLMVYIMHEYNEIHEKKFDRQRKKRFYNSIRQQVEFYLGDVNLSKDRFFSNLLAESPYIDVDVILKCNKIKKLTTKAKDITKALKESQFLSMTEDGTKIFRTVAVAPIENADECTIYVEDLPLEVDHEWLKSVFGKYGDIVYVSIPHYKTTRKIKGFAFVQFDNPHSAGRALEAFLSVNSCLSSSMQPGELKSVQTFEGERDVVLPPQLIQPDRIKCVDSNPEIDCNEEEEDDDQKVVHQLREQEDDDQPRKKKRKKERNENEIDSMENNGINVTEDVTNTKNSDNLAEVVANENNSCLENTEPTRKRKRKKTKNELIQTYGMQILSKQDWKRLRNKYLEEQRKRMHELKQQLRSTHLNQNECLKAAGSEEIEEMDNDSKEITKSESRVKFIPGVIVKLQLDERIKNVKYFKTEVKRYADVEYIDATEKDYVAFFRCSSNEIANQVIGLNRWPRMVILQGDEEQAYWEKIRNDRKEKFERKIRCCTRGKNKLIKKVETAMTTHISLLNSDQQRVSGLIQLLDIFYMGTAIGHDSTPCATLNTGPQS